MKWIIIVALIAVLGALASAGIFMLKGGRTDGERDKRMARALAWRVGLSVALFAFILFSWFMGWIAPTGVPMSR
jgi:Mn2+/Fe2+ NRAMP family transporter